MNVRPSAIADGIWHGKLCAFYGSILCRQLLHKKWIIKFFNKTKILFFSPYFIPTLFVHAHTHVRRMPVALHNSSIFYIHIVDIGGVWQRRSEYRCWKNIHHMRHVGWMWVFRATECEKCSGRQHKCISRIFYDLIVSCDSFSVVAPSDAPLSPHWIHNGFTFG